MLVTVRKTKLTDEEEFNLYHNPTAFILTGAVGGSWTLDPTQNLPSRQPLRDCGECPNGFQVCPKINSLCSVTNGSVRRLRFAHIVLSPTAMMFF